MGILPQFQARSTRNSLVNKKDLRNKGDIMVIACDNLPLKLAISGDGIRFKRQGKKLDSTGEVLSLRL